MKHFPCRLLLTFAIAFASCGCGAIEPLPEPMLFGEVVSPSSAEASIESLPQVKPENKDIGINLLIFGFSYHPDREGTRLYHLNNEVNVGLGLSYRFYKDAQRVSNLEVGLFKDSGSELAKFIGVTSLYKLADRWRLGVDLLAIQSPTYNEGDAFIAPIPHLVYDFGVAKANLIYVLRVPPYNMFSAFGLYFAVPL